MTRLRILCLSLLALCLATPALADTIYDNGPTNGETDAWQINQGHVVSDTFTVGGGGASIDGLSFAAWLEPGEVVLAAEVSITSNEFGGTTYFDQLVTFTQGSCTTNQYGYNVCVETASFSPVNLAGGAYWVNLQNAESSDSPIYWDENSGPSLASENELGTIPSESFTLFGTNGSTTTTGTVPEPASVMLLGSGILGLAGWLRRNRRLL